MWVKIQGFAEKRQTTGRKSSQREKPNCEYMTKVEFLPALETEPKTR